MKFLKSINTATKITLGRLALLPLILFFYISSIAIPDVYFFANWGKLIALILFVIAAATDWLDGFIARKYNQVTDFGKFLDPAADKMLTNLGFILILSDPIWWSWAGLEMYREVSFPYWFAVAAIFIIFARDTITDSLRFIAAKQGVTIAASQLGKIKTTLQLIAITLYMLFAFNLTYNLGTGFIPLGIWHDLVAYICLLIMTAATILTVWSGADYVRNYLKSLKEKNKSDLQCESKQSDGVNTKQIGANIKKEKKENDRSKTK